ncbi:DinB family protein [Ferruginibacter paludis]|uniref:DinB family protein n=1 Tax=Ferruginibacter paludis TaxID=1310417 RepID=UPI0025B60857|nr:DinB family protein [Ferruginibacter paludis]MDN3656418.1 DinB family protein [Ferruginibacter paludis]
MIKHSITRLSHLGEIIPPLLTAIGEPAFSTKPAPKKWSKKEIIGHLIDSATNNHQRFVRAQFEPTPQIYYDQHKWNEYSYYDRMEGALVIAFWTAYNKHLVELIKHIPEEKLQFGCLSRDNTLLTLEFLINDYVTHLEHHLRQVVEY